jgi:hypothetical protein
MHLAENRTFSYQQIHGNRPKTQDSRLKTQDSRLQTLDYRLQEITQIAIVSQNAGKQCFFVISGRNRGKLRSFDYLLCKTKPIFEKVK